MSEAASTQSSPINIKRPYRKKQTATIHVDACPDDVFALMCPVREYEWEPGWETGVILSYTGLVEEGCIFTTPAGASAASRIGGKDATWVTPVHDPEGRRLTMIKFTPDECVTRLDISVKDSLGGAAATVSYEHTALSKAGEATVDQHTEARYLDMMCGWREAITDHVGRRANS